LDDSEQWIEKVEGGSVGDLILGAIPQSERGEARGSVMVKALCYKPEGRGFHSQCDHWIFSTYIIFPAALDTGVYSVSNRNGYQKQKNNVSGGKARPVRNADYLTPFCEPIV
jgi:hypothetical protein